VSRRRFRIRLARRRDRRKYTAAEVSLNGKRVKTVSRSRITADINLTGLPSGRFTVQIVATLDNGSRVKARRRYRTCVPRKRA
jgi:hypothetical protein